jgi:hypothetical protein
MATPQAPPSLQSVCDARRHAVRVGLRRRHDNAAGLRCRARGPAELAAASILRLADRSAQMQEE